MGWYARSWPIIVSCLAFAVTSLLCTFPISPSYFLCDLTTILSRSNIVVGHAIANDFRCLNITDQDLDPDVVRDVQKHYKERSHDVHFRDRFQLPPLAHSSHDYSLKTLAMHLLQEVQMGGVGHHNAIEDAKTTMKLYRLDEFKFEKHVHLRDVDWWT